MEAKQIYMEQQPIWLVGPCAAESEEQVVETAKRIAERIEAQGVAGTVVFRAGVWKPRTNPDSFQGAGEQALAWMQRVRRETGMAVATEVATEEHIALAVEAGIDYLWLGARTTANPILVQQLADTLAALPEEKRKAIRAVLVKNPVNEDPLLWIGDMERIERCGIRVMAIHRGCGHRPCWAMAHTVRQVRPDIPLLLDPSHLSGEASKIGDLLHKAQQLCFDGAMIETHIHPEAALSDAKQQITPEALGLLLARYPLGNTADEEVGLRWLRAEIDEIDDQLWQTIARRMEVSGRVGEWKKARGVAALQPGRFEAILQKRIAWGEAVGLPRELVETIFHEIHKESLRRQE